MSFINDSGRLLIRNSNITHPFLLAMTSSIFSLTEPLAPSIFSLLMKKLKSKLTEKEKKQLYEQVKECAMFPDVTNPKSLVEISYGMNLSVFRAGRTLEANGDCHILIEGMVKQYEVVQTEEVLDSSEFPHGNILENDIRLSVINISGKGKTKIEKKKLGIGSVINYHEKSEHQLVFEALSSGMLLTISKQVYEPIVVGAYLSKIKIQQQFFNKISLFQRHFRSSLQDLINCFEVVKVGFGKKVFNEGDPVTHVYIIKEGEFILQKSINSDTKIEKGKVVIKKMSESQKKSQIRLTSQSMRTISYKIIHQKQYFGASQSLFNNNIHINSLKCHQDSSIILKAQINNFFNKLIVPENTNQIVNKILQKKHKEMIEEIKKEITFNESSQVILRSLPHRQNWTTCESGRKTRSNNKSNFRYHHSASSIKSKVQPNQTFANINKTIINSSHRRSKSFRKKKTDRLIFNTEESDRIKEIPAAIQQVVQIVKLKEEYQRLRSLGSDKKDNMFQLNPQNIPTFMKKKYAHYLKSKPL